MCRPMGAAVSPLPKTCKRSKSRSEVTPAHERWRRSRKETASRAATRSIRSSTWEDDVGVHKFKIGQSVNYTSTAGGAGRGNGIYKITQLLPPEGDDFQYKIKSTAEAHERVAKESQLNHAV